MISIIALLMAILLLTLSMARAQAKAVVCMSNLRQLGICYMLYAGDYDGSSHMGWFANDNTGYSRDSRSGWVAVLRPYYGGSIIKSKSGAKDLRLCPAGTKPLSRIGITPFSAWGFSVNRVPICGE